MLSVNTQAFLSAPVIRATVIRHWHNDIDMSAWDVVLGLVLFGLPVALKKRLWYHYEVSQKDKRRNCQNSVIDSLKGILRGSAMYCVAF